MHEPRRIGFGIASHSLDWSASAFAGTSVLFVAAAGGGRRRVRDGARARGLRARAAARPVIAELVGTEERQREQGDDAQAREREEPFRRIRETARLAAARAATFPLPASGDRGRWRPSGVTCAGRLMRGGDSRADRLGLAASCVALGVCVGRGRVRRRAGGRGHLRAQPGRSAAPASAWLSPARMRSSRFMSRETSYCQRGPSAISTRVPQRECRERSRAGRPQPASRRRRRARGRRGCCVRAPSRPRAARSRPCGSGVVRRVLSAAVSQRGPIITKSTSHDETAASMACLNSTPMSIVSTSMNTFSAPEFVGKGIVETACLAARVLAPITDEDTHGLRGVVGSCWIRHRRARRDHRVRVALAPALVHPQKV